ncbi:MAG: ATP-dependent helicase [Propionibacteriaceae bacterium]|jgi:DNA helicase-2/ATP-dependent DNA helicase PcrA|nr:ATP-dependent helicase [Propionibacteriaceae bacterium]
MIEFRPADLAAVLGVPFSDEQLAAIAAPLGSGLVQAAAGSGKTTVMAARVVWLVLTGQIEPGQVVGLTFTRKAAAQLGRRIAEALATAGRPLGEGLGEPLVATYDAFAARLVGDYGAWLGLDRPARLLDDAGRYRLAAEVVAAAAGPLGALDGYSERTLTGWVLDLDAALNSNLVDPADLVAATAAFRAHLAAAPPNTRGNVYAEVKKADATAAARLDLLALREAYAARKRELGWTEYADQMRAAIDLVTRLPVARADFARRGAVVLLDEFQDTSVAQGVLLRRLFGPEGSDPGRPVLAVGDPFQSIYGWRGASASNLADFAPHYSVAGRPAAQFGLAVNRRSDRAIIAAANDLAEPLRAGAPDRLVRAAAEAGEGVVETAGFATWDEEVTWIADRIARALTAGEAPEWREVAVLARRNRDLGDLWEALTDRDVPVEMVGVGGLINVAEVADLVATLRLVLDPADNPSLVRLLTGPRWAVGRESLAGLGRAAAALGRELDLADDAPQPLLAAVAADPLLQTLADELELFRSLARLPVLELLDRVIAVTGLDAELAARPGPAGSARRRQVARFRDAVAEYAAGERRAGLTGFLAWLDAEAEAGIGLERGGTTAEDSVKLLTVHRAKGLEWDLVFLPALGQGVFPNTRGTANPVTQVAVLPHELRADRSGLPALGAVTGPGLKAFAEALREDQERAERRLAYVAVTRARHRLVATSHWWRPGRATPVGPSPYFLALEDAARRAGTAGPRPPDAGVNPLAGADPGHDWPNPRDAERLARTAALARRVDVLRTTPEAVAAAAAVVAAAPEEVRRQVALWDEAAARLVAEAAAEPGDSVTVALPGDLTTSQLVFARRAPSEFAAALARPWPRPPSPAARIGSAFHAWVEESVRRPALLDDLDWADDPWEKEDPAAAPVAALKEAFRAGRFGGQTPVAVEHSVTLGVGPHHLRGRIDAVYDRATAPAVVPEGADWLVVDWKTGRQAPDPLQLAVYRLAWASQQGVDPGRVAAGFYTVLDDRLDLVPDPLDEAGLAALLAAPAGNPPVGG